jgi:hypothetical protein
MDESKMAAMAKRRLIRWITCLSLFAILVVCSFYCTSSGVFLWSDRTEWQSTTDHVTIEIHPNRVLYSLRDTVTANERTGEWAHPRHLYGSVGIGLSDGQISLTFHGQCDNLRLYEISADFAFDLYLPITNFDGNRETIHSTIGPGRMLVAAVATQHAPN